MLARWDVEGVAESADQVCAGVGAAGLDEAHVPLGHVGRDRQVELAHPAQAAPLSEKVTEGRHRVGAAGAEDDDL